MLDRSMYDAKEWQDQLVGQGSPELDDENYKKKLIKKFRENSISRNILLIVFIT